MATTTKTRTRTPVTDEPTPRRGRGDDSIFFDKGKDCYVGEISLGVSPSGKRRRKKVYGGSPAAVRKGLKDLRAEIAKGVTTPARYTVDDAVQRWLKLQRGRGLAPKTIEKFRTLIDNQITPYLGAAKLGVLGADDLEDWLADRATVLTTRTMREVLSILRRAIQLAQRHDLITRNVAEWVTIPQGTPSRPSKSLTLDHALAVLAVAGRLYAYIVVSLFTGIRTEEARALRWEHVHLEPVGDVPPHIEVWRSVRVGGKMKNETSRRTLRLPQIVIDALIGQRAQQDAYRADRLGSGALWEETGFVFTSKVGTPLDADNVRREFQKVIVKAGIPIPALPDGTEGTWTPRELRHSFVSLLSDSGVSIEDISKLVGHRSTQVTQVVYHHELRPVLTAGAEAMDRIFGSLAAKEER